MTKFESISHLGIGVSDMDASIRFYRDVIGLDVVDDQSSDLEGRQALFSYDVTSRRAVTVRWPDDPNSFIVLSQTDPTGGQAITADQVGIHHFAWWVDELDGLYERVVAAGAPVLMAPLQMSSTSSADPKAKEIRTFLCTDPDGIILQFDQRVG